MLCLCVSVEHDQLSPFVLTDHLIFNLELGEFCDVEYDLVIYFHDFTESLVFALL